MKIKVKDDIGRAKEIKLGFSWTVFFWGLWVPLVRADWKYFSIFLGVILALTIVGLEYVTPFVMLGVAFVYNKLYASDLYKKGYRGLTPEEDEILLNYIS